MPKKTIVGRVTSNKMDKTITVEAETLTKNPKYGKIVRKTRKYHAHDENNECNIGDIVEIEESRKLSKTKAFVLKKIIKKNILTNEVETPESVEEELDEAFGGEKDGAIRE
ncbi:30S ribosomal protein S17 [Petrotoga sp. 9PWA.NaAc.5.4]|uniref:30S ribosomal protein S17 n=1 Tax=Petrotoga sp. 9PWA.NaAc.5.4 TaxID=1434328 RepID=UPI000CB3A98D|nr:30S ribosomal protein S17 [Petrotoga sp. 9PWA.NaAc.5.4]